MNRVLVVIPAYNEAENIERVVDELITHYPELDYLIINDGSKDQTAEICRSRGYHLLDLPVNLGLAGCFQAGMKYACLKGYQYAIQFDGDGQHRPEYIESMRQKMDEGYDIVIGSRFVDEKKSFSMRMIGSRMIAAAIRLTTGVHVADPTSGMRMFNQKMIRELKLRARAGHRILSFKAGSPGGRGSGGDWGSSGRGKLSEACCSSQLYGADDDFHFTDTKFPKEERIEP